MSSFLKHDEPVLIWTGKAMLDGILSVPRHADGIVILTGLGGTFHHDAYRTIAGAFERERLATLIADVLTADEQQFDARTGHYRVSTDFLASRVRDIVEWAQRESPTAGLPVALFAGAALAPACIDASRTLPLFAMALTAPRFDGLRGHLHDVETPTLLVFDYAPVAENLRELAEVAFSGSLSVVRGVAALLENDDAVKVIAQEAALWFTQNVPALTPA